MICAYREEEVGRMFRFLRVFALLPVLFFTSNLMAAGYMCTSDQEYVECDSGYYLTKSGAGNSCASCLSVSNTGVISEESISNGTRTTTCNGLFTGGIGGSTVGTSACTGCTNPVTTCSCNDGYSSVSANGICLCQNVSESGYMCEYAMKFTHCSQGYFLNGTEVGNDCVECAQYANESVISTDAIANGSRITQCTGMYTDGTGGEAVGAAASCTGCSEEITYCSCDSGYVASGSGDSCTCVLADGYTCDLTYASCNAGYYLDNGMCESCADVANALPVTVTSVSNGGVRRRSCPGKFTGGTAGANGVSQCTGCSEDYIYTCECSAGYHDDGNGESCDCVPDDPGVCEAESRTYSTCNAGYYLTNGTCLSCSLVLSDENEDPVTIPNGTKQDVCVGYYDGGTAGAEGVEQCTGCTEHKTVISCNDGYVENLAGDCVEAVGYVCPELKKYSSCAAGYYMATKQSDGTYADFGVVQAGNECVVCPDNYTCSGGTDLPAINVDFYAIADNSVGYVLDSENQTMRYMSEYNVAPEMQTYPVGYSPVGWYTGENCTGTKYFGAEGDAVHPWDITTPSGTKNGSPVVNLYGCYEPDNITVKLDPVLTVNSGYSSTWDVVYDTAAGKETIAVLPSVASSVTNNAAYRFVGYYTSKCGGTQYFDANGKLVHKWDISYGNADIVYDDSGRPTLYAHWVINFSLDAAPGEFSHGISETQLGRLYGCGNGEQVLGIANGPAIPTRPGYAFDGFYTGENGAGKMAVSATGVQYANATATYGTLNDAGVVQLYAKWTPACTPITLNPNGGTAGDDKLKTLYFLPESTTLYKDAACTNTTWTFVDITPSRTGYYFVGFMDVEQDYSDVSVNSTLYPIIAPDSGAGTPYLVNEGLSFIQDVVDANQSPVVYAKWFKAPQMTGTGSADFDAWYNWIDQEMVEFEVEYTASCGDTTTCGVANDDASCATNGGLCADGFTLTGGNTAAPVCTPKTYTISFENGAGSDTPSVSVVFGQTDVATQLPVRTGYTFSGYFTGPDGAGCMWYDDNLSSMQDPWNVPSDTTLYAYWTPNEYTVTYDIQGGDWGATSTTQDVTYDSSWQVVLDSYPVKTGYTFGGFYDQANCKGTQYVGATANSGGLLSSTRTWNKVADTKLYACWTANKYTVTYDIQGGDWGATSTTQDVTYDSSWQVILDNYPVKTGYTFGGFYDQANCNGTQYVGATANSSDVLSSTRAWDKVANTQLYACWTANEYTVTYACGDGTGTAPADTTATYDVNFTPAANTCVRTGYTFDGWTVSGTSDVKSVGTAFKWQYTADKTLTAKWKANTYTVTYACGVGTGTAPADITATYDVNFTPAANTCVRTGYTFDGWTVSGTNDVKSAGTAFKWQYTADKTLTATWRVVDNKIIINPNGGTIGGQNTLCFRADSDALTYGSTCDIETWDWDEEVQISRPGYVFAGLTYDANWKNDITEDLPDDYYPTVTPERKPGVTSGANPPRIQDLDNVMKTMTCDASGVNCSITMYAIWVKEPVLTDGGGGPGVGDAFVNVECDWSDGSCNLIVSYNASCGNTTTCGVANGEASCVTNGGLCANGFTLSDELTAAPVCAPKRYTVSFDNDGGAATLPITVTFGSDQGVAKLTTKTGYTFNGYFTGPDGAGCMWYDEDLSALQDPWNVPANTKLYAYWTPNEYAVTYACGDGTGTAPANTTATYDENFTPAANTCVRTGYTFDGWTVSGTNDVKSAGTAFKWQYTADKTLTAKWKANTYTVTYDLQGGDWDEVDTQIVTYGETWQIYGAAVSGPRGYDFGGFYDQTDCKGKQYIDAELNSLGNLSSYPNKWDKAEDATLYACWIPQQYTVSYSCGDGTGTAPGNATATYDEDFTPAANTCVRDGYVFGGWIVSPADIFKAGEAFKWEYLSDKTLTAIWVGNTITLKFNNGGRGGAAPTSPASCEYGKTFVLPSRLYASGYTFDGWYGVDPNNVHATSTRMLCTYDVLGVYSGTATITGAWTPETYTVSYSCGDGTGTAPADTTATYDADFTPAANTCVRTGYTFDGWTVSGTNDVKSAGTAFKWQYIAAETLTAKWTIKSDINVPAGYYLPVGTDIPVACEENHYCAGIENAVFSTIANQGIVACPDNYYTDGIGASVKADCKISCAGGYYLAEYGDTECTIAGVGNWIPASTYSWDNELGAVNECPEGETTIGYGPGADEEGDCGRKFHVGANILYLRSVKKTTPSLNVKMGNKTYYGNMSEYTSGMTKADAKMSVDATDVLRITDSLTDKEYWVHDDTRL